MGEANANVGESGKGERIDGDAEDENAVGEKITLLLPFVSLEDRRRRGEGFDLS